MLTFAAAGPIGRKDCVRPVTIGFKSCTVSVVGIISCGADNGEEVCKVGTPCEAARGTDETCVYPGPETIDVTVVGSIFTVAGVTFPTIIGCRFTTDTLAGGREVGGDTETGRTGAVSTFITEVVSTFIGL